MPILHINPDIIRVVIPDGPGMGHQAASLDGIMELRKSGFKGEMEILYRAVDENGKFSDKNDKTMEKLISGFKAANIDENDKGQKINHPFYGEISIRRIDRGFNSGDLKPVRLTISFANDNAAGTSQNSKSGLFTEEDFKKYEDEKFNYYLASEEEFEHKGNNRVSRDEYTSYHDIDLNRRFASDVYIQLQPTNYPAERFIRHQNGAVEMLPSNLRIPRNFNEEEDLQKVEITPKEREVIRAVENTSTISQVVYNLNGMKQSSVTAAVNLAMLHHDMMRLMPGKTHLILLPSAPEDLKQEMKRRFRGMDRDNAFSKLIFVDLTKGEALDVEANKGNIIFCRTGFLQPAVFNSLIAGKTTYPPALEFNSATFCEERGNPYFKMTPYSDLNSISALSLYEDINGEIQYVHKNAEYELSALPERKNDIDDLEAYMLGLDSEEEEEEKREEPPFSIEEMKDFLWLSSYHAFDGDENYEHKSVPEFTQYFEDRQREFLKRPNGIEFALEEAALLEKKEISSSVSAVKVESSASQVNFDTIHIDSSQNIKLSGVTDEKQASDANTKKKENPALNSALNSKEKISRSS